MRVRAIFFDMDGTLFSSEGIIYAVYRRGVSKFNDVMGLSLEVPLRGSIMSLLGYPVDEIYDNLFPSLLLEERSILRSFIQGELLSSIECGEGYLYDGVKDLVFSLCGIGIRIFVASNGHYRYLSTILREYSLFASFEDIITLDNVGICDKGDILLEYGRRYGILSGSSIMVGDRLSDLEASIKFGCNFIFCSYGHGEFDDMSSFSGVRVSSFRELCNYLALELGFSF